jgi:hypothetical protein
VKATVKVGREWGGVEVGVEMGVEMGVEAAVEAGSRRTCVVSAEALLCGEEEKPDALAHPIEQPRQGQPLRGAAVRRVQRECRRV